MAGMINKWFLYSLPHFSVPQILHWLSSLGSGIFQVFQIASSQIPHSTGVGHKVISNAYPRLEIPFSDTWTCHMGCCLHHGLKQAGSCLLGKTFQLGKTQCLLLLRGSLMLLDASHTENRTNVYLAPHNVIFIYNNSFSLEHS